VGIDMAVGPRITISLSLRYVLGEGLGNVRGLGTGPGQGHEWRVFGGRGTLGLSRHWISMETSSLASSSKGGHLRFSLAPHPAFSDPDPFGVVAFHVLQRCDSGPAGHRGANTPISRPKLINSPQPQSSSLLSGVPLHNSSTTSTSTATTHHSCRIMVSLLLRVLYTHKTNRVSRIHPRRSNPRPCSTQAVAHRPSVVQNRPSDGHHPPCVLVHQAARP
jgi:hypothetical protein